jgi:GDP-L-fucose synthase
MIDLKKRRIAVTGGKGFLGWTLVENLRTARKCENVEIVDLPEYDLREPERIRQMLERLDPEIVIHLAATVGGIGANKENPGRFFYDNAVMGIHLIHEAYRKGVEKFVILGTICCYPKLTPVPFKEEDLWTGYPEETNAPYGLAKKMLLVQSQAYRQQYGFNSVFVMPVNLYGPRDNFDPKSSHVIPALIRKFVEAMGGKKECRERMKGRMGGEEGAAGRVANPSLDKPMEVWGTGTASREFLFVEDAAEGIARVAERYESGEPMNLGSGREITIKDLVELIARIMRYNGEIRWDASKPDGQPRRLLDVSKAERAIGFKAGTSLETGLKQTIEWFLAS